MNCYEFCHNNSYDETNDIYECLEDNICFGKINKLIPEKNNSCIDDCSKDDTYKFEFNNICYKECPKDISELSKDNKYLCNLKCPPENPYENKK